MSDEIPHELNIKDSLTVTLKEVTDYKYVIIGMKGFLDSYNTMDFQRFIFSVMRKGYIKLIINCTELNYISSSGVAAFTTLFRAIKQNNGVLVLSCLQQTVKNIFNILKLSPLFMIVDALEEAVVIIKK